MSKLSTKFAQKEKETKNKGGAKGYLKVFEKLSELETYTDYILVTY